MCDPVGAISKGVNDITSAATGGLVGGRGGSENLWGTSINQEANPWASPLAKLGLGVGGAMLAAPMILGTDAGVGTTVGANAALPAGGMTATGVLSPADAAMMGVSGGPAGLIAGGTGAATSGLDMMGALGQGINVATGLFGAFGGGPSGNVNADPFAPYRSQAAQQLMALQKNPSLVTQTPGYEAGLTAVQRSMDAQGFQGSGNMMTELSNYGSNAYNQAIQQLMTMSGASTSPATGAAINQQGNTNDFLAKIEALNRLGGMASSYQGSPIQKLFS